MATGVRLFSNSKFGVTPAGRIEFLYADAVISQLFSRLATTEVDAS